MGNTLKIPLPKKLARLGHFPPASQAGRLAGPVFYVFAFSLELDLQSLFGLLCTAVLILAETPQLPPSPFGLIYESANIDDISM
jgi:hypothetical protein